MKKAFAVILVVACLAGTCFAAPEDMLYRPRAIAPSPAAVLME